MYNGKKVFSISGAEKTMLCKRMKLEHSLTSYTKINSKWIQEVSIKSDTIKLLEENIDRTLFDISCYNILFYPHPRIMKIKARINHWDVIKLKGFGTAKEIIKTMKI